MMISKRYISLIWWPILIVVIAVLCPNDLIAQQAQTQSPHGNISVDVTCENCHTDKAWVPAKDTMTFDHGAQTKFPLLGKHGLADCESCHLGLDFTEPVIVGDGCESCHVDVHQGNMAGDCTSCHNFETFTDVDGIFVHNQTMFPLTGAHQQIECSSCHLDQSNGHFTLFETDCVDCHQQDYNEAITVDHISSGFPLTCEDCHTTLAWQPAFFEHEQASGGFALLGAHTMVACQSCHQIPSMETIFDAQNNEDCYSCHQADYQEEHGGSGFPTECIACHNVNSWDGADFDHTLASGGFELLGAHSKADCSDCHTSNYDLVFSPPPADQTDCYSCHASDYQKEHAGSGFPTECDVCHNVNDWDDAEDFDHDKASGGFELVGAHNTITCDDCHNPDLSLVFLSHPSDQDDCYSCHQADYVQEHSGTGFPTDCLTCHTTNNFEDADFDHSSVSNGFELVGAHNTSSCESCHTPDFDLVFATAPTNQNDCINCHQEDYDREHAGSGFSTDCTTCHSTDNFDDSAFDHETVANGFELLGAHNTTACESCHNADYSLVFSPAPGDQNDCYTCHEADYQQEHAGSGFPTDCSTCHNTTSFEDAEFDHENIANGFELLGAHNTTACESCHNADYSLVFSPAPGDQNDCYTCHEADYQQEHAGSGFPTDCLICHNTSSFDDADFEDHDTQYFPIYSGAHRGEWGNNCQTCHTVASDFSLFTCTDCHEHNETEMRNKHDEVRNFVYESTACYSCHPDGREDDD